MPSKLFDHDTFCSRLGSGIMRRMRNVDLTRTAVHG